MSVSRTNYAKGTYIDRSYPLGTNMSAAALCADGKVRKLKRIAETADSYFSTPAAVRYKGKTVSGFITLATASGLSTETRDDPAYLEFRATGKHAAILGFTVRS